MVNKKFDAHETRESLYQFLFTNCQSISSHFVAVPSWSVRCSRRSQKSIKPLIVKVQGLSKSSMLIRLKSSSLILADMEKLHTKFSALDVDFDNLSLDFLCSRKLHTRASKSGTTVKVVILSLLVSLL